MIPIRLSRKILCGLAGGGALCLALSLSAAAQVQTQKTEALGETTRTVKVDRGEVVYVNGNSVVIKMEDGKLEHFNNVPDSVTVLVDGQHLNVHQLKPGMHIEKQTITSSTPRVITTVETVTGKVWHVSPPNSVILTLENGENQKFNIPTGQKFTVDGQETDAWGLKKGMTVSAQRVTEVPETVVSQEIKRTGKMPPPPPQPKPDVPILVAVPVAPAPAAVETATSEPKPAKLPTTGSDLPLIALLGVLLCGFSLVTVGVRTFASRYSSSKA